MAGDVEPFGVTYGPTDWAPGGLFYLPHSCDEWEIGDVADMERFIAECRRVLDEVKRGQG